mmetsp:Transcript_53744/g.156691  ORF Transcript_53744/g.156691 Transcript_53744/m.156691 type:complete len:220 (-) Transcript_53744:968-1627(-)
MFTALEAATPADLAGQSCGSALLVAFVEVVPLRARVVLLRVGLALLREVCRLVHDVLGHQGQEGRGATQRQPALLVWRHEAAALDAVSHVEVGKPGALRNGHSARPNQRAHGHGAVALGIVAGGVLALVPVGLDGPCRGGLGAFRLQLLEVLLDALQHLMPILVVLLLLQVPHHLLADEPLTSKGLQLLQVWPCTLACGEEERRAMAPTGLRPQLVRGR